MHTLARLAAFVTASVTTMLAAPHAAMAQDPELEPSPAPPAKPSVTFEKGSNCTDPDERPRASMPAPSRVRLHVDGPRDAVVQQIRNGDWQTVCALPCDASLPAAYGYRVAGGGVRPSSPFQLDQSGPTESLVLQPAAEGLHVMGIGGMIVGGSMFLVGTFVAYFGLLQNIDARAVAYPGAQVDDSAGTGAMTTGLVMVLAGGALTIVGLVMELANGSTKLTPAPDSGQPDASLRSAPRRVPLWTATAREWKVLPSPSVGIPLLDGRF